MKKVLIISTLTLLAACSTPIERMTGEARDICKSLGYEDGTKDFRACTEQQFNRMRDNYYVGTIN